MRSRRLTAGAMVCAGGLALVASNGVVATSPPEPSGDPWVIAAVLTLSGPAAPFFASAVTTIDAAAAFVNERGGIAGRPVEVEFIDSAGDPAQAISGLTSYLDDNTPQLVFAGAVSSESEPVLPLVTQREILSTASTVAQELNDPSQFPFHFPAPPTTDQVESALADFLADQGYSKIAFLGPDNVSGQSAQAALETAVQERDMEFVSALMDPTATDATGQITRLQGEEPDVLVLSGYGPFHAVFLRSLARVGWDIPVVGDETFAGQQLGESAPVEQLNAMTLQFFDFGIAGDPAADAPAVQALAAALSEAGTVTGALWSQAVGPWNAVMIGKLAGDAAGPDADGPALAAALEGITELPEDMRELFIGSPALEFSEENHTPMWSGGDFTFVPGGALDESGLLESSGASPTDSVPATTAA